MTRPSTSRFVEHVLARPPGVPSMPPEEERAFRDWVVRRASREDVRALLALYPPEDARAAALLEAMPRAYLDRDTLAFCLSAPLLAFSLGRREDVEDVAAVLSSHLRATLVGERPAPRVRAWRVLYEFTSGWGRCPDALRDIVVAHAMGGEAPWQRLPDEVEEEESLAGTALLEEDRLLALETLRLDGHLEPERLRAIVDRIDPSDWRLLAVASHPSLEATDLLRLLQGITDERPALFATAVMDGLSRRPDTVRSVASELDRELHRRLRVLGSDERKGQELLTSVRRRIFSEDILPASRWRDSFRERVESLTGPRAALDLLEDLEFAAEALDGEASGLPLSPDDLEPLLASEDPEVRRRAFRVLGRMTSPAPSQDTPPQPLRP